MKSKAITQAGVRRATEPMSIGRWYDTTRLPTPVALLKFSSMRATNHLA